jgi:hypothetical protein
MSHYDHLYAMQTLKENNPELFGLINISTTYEFLFLSILIIGIYEMITKPSLLKTLVRILLVCIIIGTKFSYLIPINDFYYGVYNTTWFAAVVAFLLIFIKIGNYYEKQKTNN